MQWIISSNNFLKEVFECSFCLKQEGSTLQKGQACLYEVREFYSASAELFSQLAV